MHIRLSTQALARPHITSTCTAGKLPIDRQMSALQSNTCSDIPQPNVKVCLLSEVQERHYCCFGLYMNQQGFCVVLTLYLL